MIYKTFSFTSLFGWMKALYFYIVKYSLFISFDRRDLVLYNVLVIHGFYLVLLESFKKVTLSPNTDEVLVKLNIYYLAIKKSSLKKKIVKTILC